jgi:hypothetical protein
MSTLPAPLPLPPSPSMRFDGAWMFAAPTAAAAAATSGIGPTLANGKVAFVPVITPSAGLDSLGSVVAVDAGYEQVAAGFHHARFRLHAPSATGAVWTPSALSFDMRHGTLEAEHTVLPSGAAPGAAPLRVRHVAMACRHLPGFAMHTLTVSRSGTVDPGVPVVLFHELSAFGHSEARQSSLVGAEFDCSTVHGADDSSQTILTGRAKDACSGRAVHAACSYLLPTDGSVRCLGLGTSCSSSSGTAHCKLLLQQLPATLSVLVASATDADLGGSASAAEELRRAVLGVLSRSGCSATAVAAEHAAAWEALWVVADMRIAPKDGLDPTHVDAARLHATQGALRYALFNLCSAVRVGGAVALPRRQGGDGCGGLLRQPDGVDAWLLPALLLVTTGAASGALDARHAALPAATRAATGCGYRGAAFDFEGGSGGDGGGAPALWGAAAPLHVFNTALVGVNAWNRYRLTQDRDWLMDKGFPLLRAVADFVASAAAPVAPGRYTLPRTLTLGCNAGVETDNALTVHAVRTALQYACEASYELGLLPRAAWRSVRAGLTLPILPPAQASGYSDVLRTHADATGPRADGEPLDVLMPLSPLLAASFFTQASGRGQGSLTRNLDYHAAEQTAGLPVNQALLACLQARAAQQDPVRVATVERILAEFLESLTELAWGNLVEGDTHVNDPNLSAMLVVAVAQGLGGLTITGGVSETRFRYQAFGLRAASGAVLPPAWKSLQIAAAGGTTTVNRLLYASGGGLTPGAVGPLNAMPPSMVSPWSLNALT